MRLLLDTHTFLWAISEPQRLPSIARSAIEDTANSLFVSAISFWEITIKTSLGKLDLNWNDDLITAAGNAGLQTLPLEPVEAATYDQSDRRHSFRPVRPNGHLAGDYEKTHSRQRRQGV